ncbi:unnamed protein product, partial [Iphiclides podalirius]
MFTVTAEHVVRLGYRPASTKLRQSPTERSNESYARATASTVGAFTCSTGSKLKMWTLIWCTSLLAILMADIRTGAIHNNEVEPQRCYYCPNNITTCYQQKVSILCTAEEPYCGTVAVGPGYISSNIDAPHAEPLKHEATVPPDDDEDESEGSGVYDDPKSPKNPASAPAAPSSYLPAEENKASSRFQTSLALFILIMYATL